MRAKGSWDASIDETNTVHLKEIIRSHGWPTIAMVGLKASNGAWLLAQHADHDPKFQTACLELMKKLPPKAIKSTNIAYLEDRVRVNTGQPQIYGTQSCLEGGKLVPCPIEDPKNVDARRRSVGLGSFAKYKAEIAELYRKQKKAERAAQQKDTVLSKKKTAK